MNGDGHRVASGDVGSTLSPTLHECQAPLNDILGRLTLLMAEVVNLSPEGRLRPAIRPGRSAYLDRLHEISSRLSEIDRPKGSPAGP